MADTHFTLCVERRKRMIGIAVGDALDFNKIVGEITEILAKRAMTHDTDRRPRCACGDSPITFDGRCECGIRRD